MSADREQLLSEVIGSIYDAALDNTQWPVLMRRAANLFDASHGTFQLIDAHVPGNDVVLTMGFDPQIEADWQARRRDEDFWMLAVLQNIGRIVTGTELIPLDEMYKRPLYHEICRGLDVEYMLAIVVPLANDQVTGWSFLRPRSRENFGAADKHTMNLLLPHLQRAIAMRREFSVVSLRSMALEAVLDRSEGAVFLIDAQERVRFMNACARQLINRDDGVSVVGQRVRVWPSQLQEHLQRELRLCASGKVAKTTTKVLVIRGKRSGAAFQCMVFPISRNVENPFDDSQIVCALVVREPESRQSPLPEIVARLHGLTAAEARVAVRLFEGKTPDEIAELHRVSINTVRAQMKSLFRKCGVRTQSQLVRLLAGGAGACV